MKNLISTFGLSCLLMLLISSGMIAQRNITGTVLDNDTQEPLIGANIIIVGLATGTIADVEGKFSLEIPEGYNSIEISYAGYTSKTIKLGADQVYNIVLLPGIKLGEIYVSATRRISRAQSIGISVSAFSGEDLQKNNVIRTEDLPIVTEGLSIAIPGGAPLSGLIAIRGVAQNDFAAHLESANIIFVDDVYRPSNASNLKSLFDLERVEVLKGPQGTLFGRNATGGLIHMLTKDPTDKFGGYADLTVAGYGTITFQGAINLPLGNKAAFRLAGLVNHRDGYIKNSIGKDQLDDDTRALRGKLLIQPDDKWSIKLQGEYHHNLPTGAGGAFATGGFVGADGLGQFRDDPAYTDAGYVDADGDVFTGEFDFEGFFERKEYSLISDIGYKSDLWAFKSITAFSDIDAPYEEDNDLTPFDIAIFKANTQQQVFTQEFRLSRDFKKSRVTGGVYYFNIDGDYDQLYELNNLGNFNAALGVPSTFFGYEEGTILLPLGQSQLAEYEISTSSWSGYIQSEYDLNKQLTLTTGLRYTHDNKDYTYENFCEVLDQTSVLGPCAPGDPSTLGWAGLVTDNHSDGGLSARLQLDYSVNDDWLLYASYNRGYKAFDYNAGFAGAAQVEFARFEGEKLNAYEIGSKLDFARGRTRFNVSGFFYDYNDYQAFDQRGVSFILSNTEATIYGVEASFTARSKNGYRMQLGTLLLSSTVKDIDIGGVPLDRDAPQSARFQFNFGASKEHKLQSGTIRLGFNGKYTGSYFSQLTNAPVTEVGDNWLVNSRLTYLKSNGKWEISLFARNLFNAVRLLYSFDITFPGNGLVEQSFGTPRVIGTQLRVNF